MKTEAKEPAGRRRYGMAVSVSTSAGSSSCLLGGRFESEADVNAGRGCSAEASEIAVVLR